MLLPGLKGVLNPHPLFVHFPISFWLGALLFEALAVWRSSDELHRTAARLLYLGRFAPSLPSALDCWLKKRCPTPAPLTR